MAGAHRPGVTAIPLGRPSPGASSNQPERQGQRMKAPRRFKSAARRSYSVLLPAGLAMPPTLPPARCALTAPFHPCRDASGLAASDPAVCFLWRFPWGFPRRTLSGAAFRMEPGLSSASESGGRPADWLITAYGTEARAVKDNRKWKERQGRRRGLEAADAFQGRSLKLHPIYGIVPPSRRRTADETRFRSPRRQDGREI
jgi:hypothetical protein